MEAAEILREAFPVTSERTALELVETQERPDGGLALVVRLVVWEVDGEARSIRDVKEQEVYCLRADQRGDPRLAACVQGWRQALEFVLRQEDPHGDDRLMSVMPHDLVGIGELLALKRPRTADEFCDACLTGRKRLGWLVRR
jgi:hypothetical protein